MKTLCLLVVVCAVALHAAPVGAADDPGVEALMSALRANRKAVVAVNLGLSEAEATKFWPVYDRYQKEMNAIGDRLLAVVEDYTKSFETLSDEHAKKLIDDYLTVETVRAATRRAWVDDFSAVLPGRKLARFYQLENKIDAVMRYQLAAEIPVVEEPTPAKK
jgi:hypothetical protein